MVISMVRTKNVPKTGTCHRIHDISKQRVQLQASCVTPWHPVGTRGDGGVGWLHHVRTSGHRDSQHSYVRGFLECRHFIMDPVKWHSGEDETGTNKP